MTRVHIIAIETGNEPHAIRSAAEWWGADVTVTWVGNSGQVVDFFSGEPRHELIVFSAHGDESGLLLPELAPEIVRRYPYDKVIRPEDFRQFLRLKDNVVVNLSCWGGKAELAEAFLNGGARHYAGPVDAPNGSAALMYALDFAYQMTVHSAEAEQAHLIASTHDDDRRLFRLYTRDR